ncbi:AFR116Wp [Eremothecium gossypii ATCC 10895]|uniref:Probable metalloreductase AIM14 n=1 Tax=Eremothecium gossypii (strain ATCC 10895 / CBS 109.51 / FGSC 9923 / NRRL Y-1056) TaxID=284811 RepID=AIM14_EREGS|nr:AFR116Wp [Eremothecium gossypii ATCC 10895]Q754F4.1 RecName: Full=Probable metalloreductase AIM14 [Eremothecium gossypii ATCC 10895]AAS53487.1 AFR116Wp [Eremothecium gossypii ATCC 10895]AEY97799.1 FAFR116Wp [Eremothecium gossypii FDAG1]
MDGQVTVKRHGDTHFANIGYGYYTFGVSVGYILLLLLLRKRRGTAVPRSRHKLFQMMIDGSPALHLPILLLFLEIAFLGHYSVIDHASVYIKRLGRLSYVLLFLNIFLTLRPNYILSDYTYVQLLPMHMWLSRAISTFGVFHGLAFVIKWQLDNEVSLASKLFNLWNLLGFIVWILLIILLITSTGVIRRRSYKSFYMVHQINAFAISFIVPVHARPGVALPYTITIAVLLGLHALARVSFCMSSAVVHKLSNYQKGSKLVRIKLPRNVMPEHFTPGSHIRVSPYRRSNPLYWLVPSHPFTIASLPDDDHVDLILREHGHFEFEVGPRYSIVHNYEGITALQLGLVNRVTIVVGGTGISLGLPLFRYFKENTDIGYLKMIWTVKSHADLHVLDDFEGIDIFVTQNTTTTPIPGASESWDEIPLEEFELNSMDDLEAEEEHLGESGALLPTTKRKKDPGAINIGRRLDWNVELASFVRSEGSSDQLLIVCGPESLVKDGVQFATDHNIVFYKEVYSF